MRQRKPIAYEVFDLKNSVVQPGYHWFDGVWEWLDIDWHVVATTQHWLRFKRILGKGMHRKGR